ncbi:unnamed protein product [Clavelina lepadiformis]|uniref:MULE transposase domain-containing protein n=1 Tax=Clavelina lepadiformis TaxID=159417 RepID=A0ABP0G9M3_CLALP
MKKLQQLLALPQICVKPSDGKGKQQTTTPQLLFVGELFIPDMLRQTTDQRGFLLYDSGPGDVHRMLIFSTDQFLQTLHDSEHWMCDEVDFEQIDFELASKAALIEAFPQTHIYGCYFHLGQSLWRKIQENGLQRFLKYIPANSKHVAEEEAVFLMSTSKG